jgi:hypothetical protein
MWSDAALLRAEEALRKGRRYCICAAHACCALGWRAPEPEDCLIAPFPMG